MHSLADNGFVRMIRNPTFRLAFVLFCLANLPAGASVQLNIPPRLQWDEKNGYCGECSIQQIALYYGTYISQYNARAIIDPTQAQDVWVPDNSGPIFDALRLNYVAWNSALATPQYSNYLVWVKSHLQQGHPVIIDVYVNGGTDSDYDHIIPATGFTSADTNTYHAADTLVFNDNYASTPFTRTFGTLWATRNGANSGSYDYYIPRDTDYGAAVTGIKDSSGTTKPIYLAVDRWNEPDPWQSQSAVQLNATIQVSSLTVGNPYVLLRYNNYTNVPTSNFLASAYSTTTTFTATNPTQTFYDNFMSSATVIYRAVPAAITLPNISSVRLLGMHVQIQFTTQMNQLYGVDWRSNLVSGSWSNLMTNLAGTGGTLTVTDTNGAKQSQRYYRVRVAAP